MSEQTTYENNYPFSWLDEVIEITLNPEKTHLKELKPEVLSDIRGKFPGEITRVIKSAKLQGFSLYSNDQVRVIAGHYDQSIRILRRQAAHNLSQYPRSGPLFKTGQMISDALAELDKNIHARYGSYLPEPAVPGENVDSPPVKLLNKILCALSADQIGIILRSAYDVKIILGTSFRKVCQAIAPFVSTQWKKDISWDTIRSSSGRPEPRDKEIAIKALERMIEQIRGYR